VTTQLDDRDQRHGRLVAPVGPGASVALRARRLAGLLALDLLAEANPRQLVDPEGGHHLPQDLIGGHVAVLEGLDVGLYLDLDETPHGLADHLMLLAPLDHGLAPGRFRRSRRV
jgi:hypothetical protein